MNSDQRTKAIDNLINTSVDDCRITLGNYSDPTLLCELLIRCHDMNHGSREQVVRRRIAQLIKKEKRKFNG